MDKTLKRSIGPSDRCKPIRHHANGDAIDSYDMTGSSNLSENPQMPSFNEIDVLRNVIKLGKQRRFNSAEDYYAAIDSAMANIENNCINPPGDENGHRLYIGDMVIVKNADMKLCIGEITSININSDGYKIIVLFEDESEAMFDPHETRRLDRYDEFVTIKKTLIDFWYETENNNELYENAMKSALAIYDALS